MTTLGGEYRSYPTLQAAKVSLAYPGGPVIVDGLEATIPTGKVTSIIGPNGCGKSTLLRGLARLMQPASGAVLLDGAAISSQRTKEVAKSIGLLPQGAVVPEGLVVEDLVARGRYPHQTLFKQWSEVDEAAVEHALVAAGAVELRDRPVEELSGGQRQRVWIALTLAQETPILLLDEPTTFLDLAHQLEVLNLIVKLNREENRTIVMVLHDINHAARYSHHIIAMSRGRIHSQGHPVDVVTEDVVAALYNISSVIIDDPVSHTPLCVPRAELPSIDAADTGTAIGTGAAIVGGPDNPTHRSY